MFFLEQLGKQPFHYFTKQPLQLFKKNREIERFIWTMNTSLSCCDQIKPTSFSKS